MTENKYWKKEIAKEIAKKIAKEIAGHDDLPFLGTVGGST
jgi:hypothetical protein